MAFIEYDDLNEGAQYNTFRFGVMKAVWGAQKNPYLDIHKDATIGTDLDMTVSSADLRTIAEAVLGTVDRATLDDLWAAVNQSYKSDAALRNALDGVLGDHGIGGHFTFADEQHMKQALNGLSTTISAESQLTWSDQDLPFSEERAVVFSIAYEGVDVGNILDAMLSLDSETPPNRFNAWFEIRYDSNNDDDAGKAERAATAQRRYVQSDIFELYNDPKNVGYDEAFDVATRYRQNRHAILAYEHKYDPDAPGGAQRANGLGAIGGNINDALQPAIAAITKHFGIATGHLDEVLYVSGGSHDLDGDGSGFDSKKNDDDLLIGDSEDNAISGDVGNDAILGLGGNDDLVGGAGNDRLYGHSGNDVLAGGAGRDKADGGAGNDRLVGGDGNDWLYGNAGKDRLDGGAGNDTLLGGNDDDQVTGGGGKDRINAGYGNDTVDGGGSGDRILGFDGKDRLDGGAGNDTIDGGNDNDRLTGGGGNDHLDGGGGTDTLIGGAGNDTYVLGSDRPDKTHPDPDPGPDPDPDPEPDEPDPSLVGGGNSDQIVEDRGGGTDTVIIGAAGTFNIRNVEKMRLSGDVSGNVSMTLNEFDSFALGNKADTLTLTINKLQKDAIHIATGGGADTVRIHLAPGIDPSQVLDHKGLTARFDFTDLTAGDTIDLTSIGIRKIVTNDLDITQDSGFYLMAPDTKIHLMHNGHETKTYNNDTDSWFVVKCGDDTPYGPEIFGHVTKDNFDI
jgi:Ca2+-binding RTX toxin-like protein